MYHVEDWVARTLRGRVPIGVGATQYRIAVEADELRRIKEGTDGPAGRWGGLTESVLAAYLTGRDGGGHFHNPQAEEAMADLQALEEKLNGSFDPHPLPLGIALPDATAPATVEGIEAAIRVVRERLDSVEQEVNDSIKAIKNPDRSAQRDRSSRPGDSRLFEQMKPTIRRAREAVSALRDRLIGRLPTDYPAVLAAFYGSDVVADAVAGYFGREVAGQFARDAGRRLRARHLSQFDRYLLLWAIHILTRGASEQAAARPLPQYSHTVIDEAQYYHPLVLRLLVDLSRPPLRSVTLVGDLEQKVSNDGGLVEWKDAGIRVEKSNIFRLNTNYRWSKAVFGFLDIYRGLAGLWELKEPRHWASGAGVAPEVVSCTDRDQEVDWLVERISQIRRKDWSVVVVAPLGLDEKWRDTVARELATCDIRSRWATGDHVRECEEKIIITDYDSVVGLEFDAVFLPSCQLVLAPPSPSRGAIQAAWVALTRAKKFIAVSYTAPIAVFDDPAFGKFRAVRT